MVDVDWAQAQQDIGDEIAARDHTPESVTEPCAECQGTGEVPTSVLSLRPRWCGFCDGTGLVPVEMFD